METKEQSLNDFKPKQYELIYKYAKRERTGSKGLSPEVIQPVISSGEHRIDDSTDYFQIFGQNFDDISIKYKELEPNRRQYFADLCFDQKFQQLIKTGVIDEIALQNSVSNCRTIAEQLNVFRNTVLLTEEDIRNRTELKNVLETILKESGIGCVLHFFGSTDNSIGFCNSDIDLFIEIHELNNRFISPDFKTSISYLTQIKTIIQKVFNFYIPDPIHSRRCPLIKIDFKNLNQNISKEFENLGIVCDISITNGLGLQNTKLIQLFCELESRFQELVIILKYWAKCNEFIDGMNGFTTYAFTQLVIFFCQNLSPPLLPTVDQLRQLKNESLVVNGWECGFCCHKNLIPKSLNTELVIELLPKFFKFYANFDFTTQVIRTKTGLSVHKYFKTKIDFQNNFSAERPFRMTSFCCIEEPFDLNHNLSANLKFNVFDKFLEYIKAIALKTDLSFRPIKPNIAEDSDNNWGISKIIAKLDPTSNNLSSAYITTIGRNICFPNIVRLCINNTNINVEDVIKTMAKEYYEMALNVLQNVYKIQTQITSKRDIVLNTFLPFVEFSLDIKAIDLQIIDSNNRQIVRLELKQQLDSKTMFNREKAITDELIARFSYKQLSESVIKCRFILSCNARPSGPYIEYKLIEMSSETNVLKLFLETLFSHYSSADTPPDAGQSTYSLSDWCDWSNFADKRRPTASRRRRK